MAQEIRCPREDLGRKVKKVIGDYEYSMKRYGKNPRILIIGEDHDDTNHLKSQVDILQEIETETLVHEFARNFVLDFSQGKIYENPDFRCPATATSHWMEKIGFYTPYGDLKEIKRWLEQKGLDIKLYPPQLLTLVDDLWESDLCKNKFRGLLDSLPKSVKKVVGCDLSVPEKFLYEEINNIDFCLRGSGRKHHKEREQRFAKVIADESEKLSGHLVAIIGTYHVTGKSFIHSELAKTGLEYICIYEPRAKFSSNQRSN